MARAKTTTNSKVRIAPSSAKGMSFERLMSVPRISQIAVSPNGDEVAWTVTTPDVAANKMTRSIWSRPLPSGDARELTPGPGNHHSASFSPDGASLAFVSTREETEGDQLWILPRKGGEARQITSGYGGVGSPIWNPDSRRIAFQRDVVVSNDYVAPKPSKKPEDKVSSKDGPKSAQVYGLSHPKSSARIADELLFRHWDTWRNRRRHHLFLVDTHNGKINDLTPFDCDTPPISLGSDCDFDFHPSGAEIAYVMNPDKVVARSTNNSIFIQKIRGLAPEGPPISVSTSDACDNHPRYSTNGRDLVYLAMSVPGYEADRARLKIYNRETEETLTRLETFDRSPGSFVFTGPEAIAFLAPDRGYPSVYRCGLTGDAVTQITNRTYNSALLAIPRSDQLLVTRQSSTEPTDLFLLQPGDGIAPILKNGPRNESSVDAGATARALTRYRSAVSRVPMNDAEEFWGKGANNHPIHGFLIRPAGFSPRKKYPLILLIHGGPQSAFGDDFHYRWNAQHFASHGAVVAMVNPRGSTGYGQKFTDQISGDWGGKCYQDIMKWLDQLLDAHSFLDPNRVAAAGASFGGFMVNWICGHTDRFSALVCHDGIFNAETMAYTTEELWFDEHEHEGLPHENRKPFLKYSPHLSVKNFKTPMLVVQGGQDFRCPDSEGLGMYTALQVMNVPSRFLYFPDEGHWVMQLANAQVWYEEVLDWLMKHLGPRS